MFEQDFEALLKQYSDAVDDKKRFSSMVKDIFPEQAKHVNLLLMAYNLGIAQELQKINDINNSFAFRYVKMLMDNFGLSRVNADWIVSVWCVCYGQKTLHKNCDIKLQVKGGNPAIADEQNGASTQKYGDLFQYGKSSEGVGLVVRGFLGNKNQTVIFQNRNAGQPVIEIGEELLSGTDIEGAILTDGIKYIGNKAFADCKKLHQIVLPYTLVDIGDKAFENCESLKSIALPGFIEKIGNGAFKGTHLKTIDIPKTVYWIGEELFADCKELDNVKLPSNIDRITRSMFEGCVHMKKISLNETLNAIEERAFAGCSDLDFIVIPDSVVEIGENAFQGVNNQFIIQCSFGSYAEAYARKNKIKYQLV